MRKKVPASCSACFLPSAVKLPGCFFCGTMAITRALIEMVGMCGWCLWLCSFPKCVVYWAAGGRRLLQSKAK